MKTPRPERLTSIELLLVPVLLTIATPYILIAVAALIAGVISVVALFVNGVYALLWLSLGELRSLDLSWIIGGLPPLIDAVKSWTLAVARAPLEYAHIVAGLPTPGPLVFSLVVAGAALAAFLETSRRVDEGGGLVLAYMAVLVSATAMAVPYIVYRYGAGEGFKAEVVVIATFLVYILYAGALHRAAARGRWELEKHEELGAVILSLMYVIYVLLVFLASDYVDGVIRLSPGYASVLGEIGLLNMGSVALLVMGVAIFGGDDC